MTSGINLRADIQLLIERVCKVDRTTSGDGDAGVHVSLAGTAQNDSERPPTQPPKDHLAVCGPSRECLDKPKIHINYGPMDPS